MARNFEAKPAIRNEVPLLVGIEGPPGGGKTVSSLLLAQGMQDVRGGPIIVIDTEARRSSKYQGVKVGAARPFEFDLVDFEPPYQPDHFLEAIRQQLPRNPAAIVVDSLSDEHEGEGGVLDWHDKILDEKAGDNWQKRDQFSQAAWIKPKAARRVLINGILRVMTPLIFTFRAREKTKPIEQDRSGRKITVPTNIGYQPIAPAEIVHCMDIMCLLPARADGVPRWRSDKSHEDFIIKLPEQFRDMFRDGQPITPATGAALAQWARGGSEPAPPAEQAQAGSQPPSQPRKEQSPFKIALASAIDGGEESLKAFREEQDETRRQWLDDRWDDLIDRARRAQMAEA